jgi:hypothetical protein
MEIFVTHNLINFPEIILSFNLPNTTDESNSIANSEKLYSKFRNSFLASHKILLIFWVNYFSSHLLLATETELIADNRKTFSIFFEFIVYF